MKEGLTTLQVWAILGLLATMSLWLASRLPERLLVVVGCFFVGAVILIFAVGFWMMFMPDPQDYRDRDNRGKSQ